MLDTPHFAVLSKFCVTMIAAVSHGDMNGHFVPVNG